MALTITGVIVATPNKQLPAGYDRPTVTPVADTTYMDTTILNVAKSVVEDADQATTVNNILTEITTQLTAQFTADLDVVGKTVDAYAKLITLDNNLDVNEELFTSTAPTYNCTVQYFVKIT